MTMLRPALSISLAVLMAAAVLPAGSATAKKAVAPAVSNIAYEQWDSGADFDAGVHSGTGVSGENLELAGGTTPSDYTDPFGPAGNSTTYDVGTWTSPTITPGFGYTELVASWNAKTPAGTWVEVSVSGLGDDGVQSKSYVLGRWAEGPPGAQQRGDDTFHRTSVPAQGDDLATVSIDTLVARAGRSLSTWQLEVSLYREQGSTSTPSVSLVGAMASALPTGVKKPTVSQSSMQGTIELAVPPYSQETHIGHYPEYNGGGEAWCSPTSTAMVLGYWQQEEGQQYGPAPADYAWATSDNDPYADNDLFVDYAAANTYDYNYDGTGNWPFNTAYAGRYGLESFVTRLRSLTEAEQFIKAGIPLVVSISFKESELDGAGYGTNGHLMVIRGFTATGDVIANDPASHLELSNDAVPVVYDRAQFESVWANSGKLVYVIHPADVDLPPAPAQANW